MVASSRGTVRAIMDGLLNFAENEYVGVNVFVDGDIESILFSLQDNDGNWVKRYYVPTRKNLNNLLLFHKNGFNDKDNFDFSSIKEIRLDLYYNSLEDSGDFINLKINELMEFRSIFSVYRYFQQNDIFFPENMKYGNIY